MRAPARAAQLAAAWLLALAAAAGAQVLPEIGASGSNSTAGGSDSPCARAYEYVPRGCMRYRTSARCERPS